MIISCPHCQTQYQVTYEAIGSAGRKVQCAQCQQAWQQAPIKPSEPSAAATAAFDAIVEDGLDEALEAEEKAVAAELARRVADEENRLKSAEAAKIDPSVIRSRQRAFSKRQDAVNAGQPLARFRRAVRVVLALLLCGVIAGAYFARTMIVERYPAMAGVYEQIGLGVNVVGLEFSNVSTLRTLRNGQDLLVVSAQIVGLNPTPTKIPAVVITLLDTNGTSIYAWSVAPAIADLMAGERGTFDTQLVMPPGDAERVKLSFAEANAELAQAGGGEIPVPVPAPVPNAHEPSVATAEPVAPLTAPKTPEHH